uniref:Uncharacterized protein n=1 Tax=Arundo donax TaxID=35708 RepID=A0A0A9CQM6_ARUDO
MNADLIFFVLHLFSYVRFSYSPFSNCKFLDLLDIRFYILNAKHAFCIDAFAVLEYNVASMAFAGHIHGATCVIFTLLN